MCELDSVRMAAYLDTEGCISIRSSIQNGKKYFNLRIEVYNTDKRLVDWCQEIWTGSVTADKHKQRTNKICYHWSVTGKKAAEILKQCLPYFVIKREQAEIGIEFYGLSGRGGVKDAPETVAKRAELQMKLSGLKR